MSQRAITCRRLPQPAALRPNLSRAEKASLSKKKQQQKKKPWSFSAASPLNEQRLSPPLIHTDVCTSFSRLSAPGGSRLGVCLWVSPELRLLSAAVLWSAPPHTPGGSAGMRYSHDMICACIFPITFIWCALHLLYNLTVLYGAPSGGRSRTFAQVKVRTPQCINTQVKVPHSKFNLSKSTKIIASEYNCAKSTHYAELCNVHLISIIIGLLLDHHFNVGADQSANFNDFILDP